MLNARAADESGPSQNPDLHAGLASAGPPTHVLFISVDDLRPEMNAYGVDGLVTPNLDRLAREGTVFNRAYCQFAVCGPSRASLMSGLRPTQTRFIIDRAQPGVESDAPGTLTLSRLFKQHGYRVEALGKIYHDLRDDLEGWTAPVWSSPHPHNRYLVPENQAALEAHGRYGPSFEAADVPDDAYPDGQIAREAVSRIELAAELGEPLFLAVGFWRPHLPFNAPQRYWDYYPEESVALPDNMFDPEGIPGIAMHNHPELRLYTDIPKGNAPIPDDLARTLIRGYRASVSYTDAQIGLLLDALDRTGLKDQTIILLWGDHGWHLGDNNLWGKESLFEHALRVPLIVVDPRIPGGHRTDALVELVDVYPTLAELAGLPLPDHLEGTSMAPLLRAPDAPWKEAVFSCFIRPDRNKSGWTVRDDRYRYAEWNDAQGDRLQRVLFDLHRDPLENRNLAGDPESQPVIERMHRLLHGGWQPHQRSLVP